jgi:hypothetical protein
MEIKASADGHGNGHGHDHGDGHGHDHIDGHIHIRRRISVHGHRRVSVYGRRHDLARDHGHGHGGAHAGVYTEILDHGGGIRLGTFAKEHANVFTGSNRAESGDDNGTKVMTIALVESVEMIVEVEGILDGPGSMPRAS